MQLRDIGIERAPSTSAMISSMRSSGSTNTPVTLLTVPPTPDAMPAAPLGGASAMFTYP
jgi:hypothetical protein